MEALRRARRAEPVAAERRPHVALALLAHAARAERDRERAVDLAGGAEVHPMGAGVDDDGGFGGARSEDEDEDEDEDGEKQEQRWRGGWETAWAGRFATAVPPGRRAQTRVFRLLFSRRRAAGAHAGRQTVNRL